MAQYVEELLGQFTTVDALDGIGAIEHQQAVGTRMLLVLNFRWRFPLFEQLAGGLSWLLRRREVTPWPEHTDIVFAHATEPIWYIAWLRNPLWTAVILPALIAFFAGPVGVALTVIFLGALLYRIIPRELTEPVEEFVGMLPPLLAIAAMGLLVGMLPALIERVPERIVPERKGG